MGKLIVSLSPHVHGTDSVERNMYGVIIALLPALLVSFAYFGLGAVVVCAASVLACVFFEWVINKYLLNNSRNTITDGSAILTGLLLGFNLPSNIPVWIVIIGALFAIGVAKMTFGGLGCNIFNPALAGRCFLLVSFPAQMTSWPEAGQLAQYADATTGATPLALIKAGQFDKLPDVVTLFVGYPGTLNTGAGCLGEVCELALLIGLFYMLWKKIITWHIPVSILGSVFAITGILYLVDSSSYVNPLYHLASGGLLLGAIFMATDYVTSPMSAKGQIIYGVCIGVLTVVIRNWGSYPEGMSFAILIMNAFTPLINNYVKPKRFGEVVKK